MPETVQWPKQRSQLSTALTEINYSFEDGG